MALSTAPHLLFVCTANVCRSPIAEAFATKHAASADLPLHVSSASIEDVRRPRHRMAVELASEVNIAISRMSTPLSQPLVETADIILTMTGQHAIAVAGRYRQATAKVFMLDHFVQIVDDESQSDRLHDLWTQPRSYPVQQGATDIADPMGEPDDVFRAVANQIDDLTRRLVQELRGLLS